MRPFFAAIAGIVLLAMTAPQSVGTSPNLTVSVELHYGEWVAWRFNFTENSQDLELHPYIRSCHADGGTEARDGTGFQWFHVKDGRFVGDQVGDSEGAGHDIAEVGLAGHTTRVYANGSFTQPRECGSFQSDSPPTLGANRSFTLILVVGAPLAWFNATAAWTHGVQSWDLQTGFGVVQSFGEFQEGASASVYPPFIAATAAVALHTHLDTIHDVVGGIHFTTGGFPLDATGVVYATCAGSPTPCENGGWEGDNLISHGPQAWDINVLINARAMQTSGPMVFIATLPSDDYLS